MRETEGRKKRNVRVEKARTQRDRKVESETERVEK